MFISKEKKEKISEQILAYLYSVNPKPVFISNIAKEIARDEEFIKNLLLDLKKNKFVIEIKKNSKGINYIKRSRWKLTDEVYQAYKSKQILT
jgi:predicted transcriptional regulator with HTH domain